MKDTPRITYYLKLRNFCEASPKVDSLELMNLILDCLIEEASVPKNLADFTLVNDLKALAVVLHEDSESYFVDHLNEIMLGGFEKMQSDHS